MRTAVSLGITLFRLPHPEKGTIIMQESMSEMLLSAACDGDLAQIDAQHERSAWTLEYGVPVRSVPHIPVAEDPPTYQRVQVVTPECPFCHGVKVLDVPERGYLRWLGGAFVQEAFPEMPADDRERLITGVCGPCWNAQMGEEG